MALAGPAAVAVNELPHDGDGACNICGAGDDENVADPGAAVAVAVGN